MEQISSYPAYKESGVPWLGQIPAHWECLRAKNVFTRVDVRSESGTEELLTVSSNDGVVPRREKTVTMFMAESYVGYKLCWPGDLVINSLWAWARGLGFARHHGIVSSAYGVYRLRSRFTEYWRYLDYALRSDVYQWEFQVRSKGIWVSRLQLTDEAFFDMPVILPSQDEVKLIARYLDHVDRQIRRFIRAKRRTIELLNEQKQTIIHQAVTRGLDPTVPLKPSGIEWLGDVPAHWTIRKLGHIAKIFNGTTPSRMQPMYWEAGTIPWLSSGKVNDYLVLSPTEFVTERALQECSISLVPRGSVIVGLVGQGKTRGMSALLGIDTCINQNLAAIIPNRELDSCFLLHLLTAFYKPIREIGRGGNQEALNCDIISRLRFPIPPVSEQVTLVEEITRKCQFINLAISHTQREIDLIREYRTRLIADVVTGKLDVRAAAHQLPAVVDEADLWDDEPSAEAEHLAEVEEVFPDDDN